MPVTKENNVFNQLFLIVGGSVSVFLIPIVVIYSPLAWYYDLPLAVAIGFSSAWGLNLSKQMASYKRREREPEDWMRQIQPDNQWLSDKQWQRICHVLGQTGSNKSPEDRSVELATRKNWFYGFIQLLPSLLLGILLLGLLGAMIFAPLPAAVTDWWWAILLLLPLVALVGWFQLFDWLYWYFVIDDENIIILRLPPAIFFWLNDPTIPAPLAIGQSVTEEPMGIIGNILHFGRITYATNLQDSEDKYFRDILYMPYHKQIAIMLRTRIGTNPPKY